jgi:hypothetical protein
MHYPDTTPQLVLGDYLRIEGEQPEVVAQESVPMRRLSQWDMERFLDRGSGSGYGSGRGSGRGRGRGSGRGSGRGYGSGSGSGRGSGYGSGSGSGRGRGITTQWGLPIMEIGKAYLIHCGDWHTFIGRVVAQTGPWTYQLEHVSKIHDTHGSDNWEQLAAGNKSARDAADYRHYTTPAVVPLTIAAFEWEGLLPQEEMTAPKATRK